MKYIILINKRYPYDKGESFIENELVNYSDVDKIIVFPTDSTRNSKLTRETQHNVSLIPSNISFKYLYKIKMGIKAISHLNKKEIKNNKIEFSGLKQKWFASYFLEISNDKLKHITDYLKTLNFTLDDQIVIYSYWLYTTAYIGIGVKEYFNTIGISSRVISRAHRFDIYGSNVPFKEQMVSKLEGIYPCSDNGTEYLRDLYKKERGKIKTAYLGTIDQGGLCEINDKINKFVIVSCSRITKIKRVERIAEALKQIDNRIQKNQLHWVHIGTGHGLEKLQKFCEENFKNITFEFKGYKPNSEVYNYYKNHKIDLFINVSISEGLPVSIMEAISFGIPIVATDVGGTKEIVNDNINGKLLDKDFSNRDLENAILYYIAMNSGDYSRQRIHSRELWEKKYNAEFNYKMFLEEIFGANYEIEN